MHSPAQTTHSADHGGQLPLTRLSAHELQQRLTAMEPPILTRVANAAAESAGRNLALALRHRARGDDEAAAEANAAAVRMAAIHNAAVSTVPAAQD